MLTIRPANLADAQAIQAIYAPYVEKTAITFEYEVPVSYTHLTLPTNSLV